MEFPVLAPTFTCTPEGTPKPLTSPSGNPAGPGGTTSTPGVSVTHSILEGLAPHAMMCLSCPSQGEVSRAMTYHLVGRERQPTEESERGQPTAGPQSSDFLCGWLANYRNSCPQGGASHLLSVRVPSHSERKLNSTGANGPCSSGLRFPSLSLTDSFETFRNRAAVACAGDGAGPGACDGAWAGVGDDVATFASEKGVTNAIFF